MSERPETVERAETEASEEETDYDRYAQYEDGDATVVCDRMDPNAWIKSTVVTDVFR